MSDPEKLVEEIEALGRRLAEARASIATRIIGQGQVVDLSLAALLSGGHALLMGLPGLGKTLLVDTLSTVMGLTAARMLPDALADVGSLEIAITRDQPRVTASTSVSLAGLGAQDFEVQTSLEAETGIRLKETYASLKAFGREQDIPANLRYSRKLFVTYLDEDILVMRDESGVPDVLLRKGSPEGVDLPDEGTPGDGTDEAP